MTKFFTRLFILNKRLFRKPAFVSILCAVPLLIIALSAVTARTDGFVRIALTAKDPADKVAREVISRLAADNGIVRFTTCDSPDNATDLVRYGEVDGAWVFSADVVRSIADAVNARDGEPCVTIIEREDTVALRLAREKLTAALSADTSFAVMRESYAKKVSSELDETKLRGFFDRAVGAGEIFEFKYTSGETMTDDGSSYLMLPIRGILAAAVLLCGFAMAMFCIRDDEEMVFCRISRARRPFFEFGYHLTGIVDVAIAVLISLHIAGLAASFRRELAAMAVYCLICAAFAVLVRHVFRTVGRVAAITPLAIVAVVAVNPVMFNLPSVYPIRVLTPLFYYLQSIHDTMYLLYGMIYFTVIAALGSAVRQLTDRA